MRPYATNQDIRSLDKNYGLVQKINSQIKLQGIYNISNELTQQFNMYQGKIFFRIYILGQSYDGGIYQTPTLSDTNPNDPKQKKTKQQIIEEKAKMVEQYPLDQVQFHFEDIENENQKHLVKFQDDQDNQIILSEEKVGEQLVLFEESVLQLNQAHLYVVKYYKAGENENIQKIKQKQRDEIAYKEQIFVCNIPLAELKIGDASTFMNRFLLQELDEESGQLKQACGMYIKLEFTTDIAIGVEYKKKFNFELSEILKSPDQENDIDDNIIDINLEYNKICKPFYDFFYQIVKNDETILKQFQSKNFLKPFSNQSVYKEVVDQIKHKIYNNPNYTQIQTQLKQLIIKAASQQHGITNLNGIKMNENDKYYTTLFTEFQKYQNIFIKQNTQAQLQSRGYTIANNDQQLSDYYQQLQDISQMSITNFYQVIINFYIYLGNYNEAFQLCSKVQQLSQNDHNINLLIIQLKQLNQDINIENSIVQLNIQFSNNIEYNYLFFLNFIEKVKIKESIQLLRYLSEKFPSDVRFVAWMLAIFTKFSENQNLVIYYKTKLKRMFMSKKQKYFNNIQAISDIYKYNIQGLTKSKLNIQEIQQHELETELQTTIDNFLINESINLLEKGFQKSASFMLEIVHNKKSINYIMQYYAISVQEKDDEIQSLEQLISIIQEHGIKHKLIMYEAFQRLNELEGRGIIKADKIIIEIMSNIENFNKRQQYVLLYNITNYYAQKEQFQLALQIAFRGYKLFTYSIPLLILIGDIYYQMEDYQNSLEQYKQANFYDNINAEVLYKITSCLLHLGESCRIHSILRQIKNIKFPKTNMAKQVIMELNENGFIKESKVLSDNISQ